jgi:peptide/nickel transport system permease protein
MSRYLGRKLMILLPSLFIITSLVFIFQKAAFEQTSFSDEEEASSLRSGAVSTEVRERVRREYRHKTGQDLPVFYLSVRTSAEPDTLYRVWLARDRDFLKKMLGTYGNWPLIAAYYQKLLILEAHTAPGGSLPVSKAWNQGVANLFRTTAPAEVRAHLAALKALSPGSGPAVTNVNADFERIVQTRRAWQNRIPVIHWNGLANQYHRWLSQLLRGNLGQSLRDSRAVTSIIGEALTNTWLLVLSSLTLSFGLATGLGVWLSFPHRRKWEKGVLNFLYVTDTLPLFILSFLIVLLLTLSGLSAYVPLYGLGHSQPSDGMLVQLVSRLHHLTAPILCLTVSALPYLTRQIHQSLQQVLPQDYIRTARAKGLPESAVIGRHALRNALLPIITLLTGFLPAFVGGVLVVELIFSIPGMGRLLADSVMARDYPVIMGIVLCLALIKMLALLLADFLYYLADPRIRFE